MQDYKTIKWTDSYIALKVCAHWLTMYKNHKSLQTASYLHQVRYLTLSLNKKQILMQ